MPIGTTIEIDWWQSILLARRPPDTTTTPVVVRLFLDGNTRTPLCLADGTPDYEVAMDIADEINANKRHGLMDTLVAYVLTEEEFNRFPYTKMGNGNHYDTSFVVDHDGVDGHYTIERRSGFVVSPFLAICEIHQDETFYWTLPRFGIITLAKYSYIAFMEGKNTFAQFCSPVWLGAFKLGDELCWRLGFPQGGGAPKHANVAHIDVANAPPDFPFRLRNFG